VERFDSDLLDDGWPFEIDHQVSHLFKHPHLGVDDIRDMWANEPLLYSRQAASSLAHGRRSRWPGFDVAPGPLNNG
jgi:hypothetical protein